MKFNIFRKPSWGDKRLKNWIIIKKYTNFEEEYYSIF